MLRFLILIKLIFVVLIHILFYNARMSFKFYFSISTKACVWVISRIYIYNTVETYIVRLKNIDYKTNAYARQFSCVPYTQFCSIKVDVYLHAYIQHYTHLCTYTRGGIENRIHLCENSVRGKKSIQKNCLKFRK